MEKVEIEGCKLEESHYKYSDGAGWWATTLVKHAKGLKPFKMPLIGIDTSMMNFKVGSIHQFVHQIKRVNDCDLQYPIIMCDRGEIIDGWHRVCKALLNGDEYIKAVRFKENPPFDFES